MAAPTPYDQPHSQFGDPPEHSFVTLSEEQASQGYKTGHMRWVLVVSFAVAGIALGLTAILA